MLQSARVAVVIPAYNEERLLPVTLAGVPDFVDLLIVVDDASHDHTADVAAAATRVQLERHTENRGVGAAIVTGYRAAVRAGADVIVVMAADAQMHPDDLASVAMPVATGEADYVKGDRFAHRDVRRSMPWARRIAGGILSRLTRWATGLDALSDSQCGYTAISSLAVQELPLERMYPRYGYPNDLLGMLTAGGFAIVHVPVRPVYADERSGIRAWHVLIILGLIARIAARRFVARGTSAPTTQRRARAMSSST
jgi:glycosyltransferase involved in cell wall biosynthesis